VAKRQDDNKLYGIGMLLNPPEDPNWIEKLNYPFSGWGPDSYNDKVKGSLEEMGLEGRGWAIAIKLNAKTKHVDL